VSDTGESRRSSRNGHLYIFSAICICKIHDTHTHTHTRTNVYETEGGGGHQRFDAQRRTFREAMCITVSLDLLQTLMSALCRNRISKAFPNPLRQALWPGVQPIHGRSPEGVRK
jgi:hypothetical protein